VFRANVPDMAKARHALAKVLTTNAWRSYDSPTGAKCNYDDFATWVTAPVPLGLCTTVENLWEISRGDEELAKLVRPLVFAAIPGASEHRGRTVAERNARDMAHDSSVTPGKETLQIVSRLKRDDPSLAEQVVGGEITPYEAQRIKGWKPPRIYVSTPERTAVSLRKHMSHESLLRLVELLTKED